MKYRINIGNADFDTKTRKVAAFLEKGHQVKLTIMFKGREVNRPEAGSDLLIKVSEVVKDISKMGTISKLSGKNMTVMLYPKGL